MARVTIEDCLKYIPNRFELIMVARKRAIQIDQYGKEPLVDNSDKHKPTVVALKEIAANLVDKSILDEIEVEHKFREVDIKQPPLTRSNFE